MLDCELTDFLLSLEHVGEHGSGNHFNTMPDASVTNVGSITHQNKKPHMDTLHTKYCSTEKKTLWWTKFKVIKRSSQDASSPCRCSRTWSGEMREIKTSVSRTPRWYHNTQKDFHMVICHSSDLALDKNGYRDQHVQPDQHVHLLCCCCSCSAVAFVALLLLSLLSIAFIAWLLLLVLCCCFCCL